MFIQMPSFPCSWLITWAQNQIFTFYYQHIVTMSNTTTTGSYYPSGAHELPPFFRSILSTIVCIFVFFLSVMVLSVLSNLRLLIVPMVSSSFFVDWLGSEVYGSCDLDVTRVYCISKVKVQRCLFTSYLYWMVD